MQSESINISLGNLNFCNIFIRILLFLNVGRGLHSESLVILHVRAIFVAKMRHHLYFFYFVKVTSIFATFIHVTAL